MASTSRIFPRNWFPRPSPLEAPLTNPAISTNSTVAGVIFSTILGFAFIQIPWESHVVFSAFFGRAESRAYWRSYAGFAVCALAVCALAWVVTRAVPVAGIPGLFAKAAAAATATVLCMSLTFRGDLVDLLRRLRRR